MKTAFHSARFCFALLLVSAILTFQTEAADDFAKRMDEVKTAIAAKRGGGKEAFFTELESQARRLMKDFPDRSEPYEMLLAVAQNTDDEGKTKALLKELASSSAPAEVKESVQGLQARAEAVGKPVDIKFESLDGRKIDVSSMKGKVVLVDFWATWCGPCVGEIPHVKEAFEKLHPKGFEIVGISFDKDKSKLEDFVKEKGMSWPQYFDGKGWQNEFGQKFGIHAIPEMWLVDKKGILRDMNGRENLTEKVEKLLAE